VLVLALVPSLFLPFGIFVSVALIASIGDAAASIMGIKFGKIHFPKNSKKTIIGYISGFFTSFFITLIILYFFENHLNFTKIIIISFCGALVFFLIDLSSLKIDDNITNPLLCTLIMGLLYYFI
ncbi:MAG: phosphatidate cytidylyltransferase, partial [Candidatus Hermodarchaeota archaeon]